jgi:arylsulfatase A-like enzyme
LIGLLGVALQFSSSYALAETSKPNVLLVFTDDHRFTGVHSLGGQQVQTPHLDQLKKEGLAFTNAYLMGSFSGATCIPSRATLHSGRQLFKLKGIGKVIPPEHKTIGETFKQEGYYSYIVGKWHQDLESLARSFDSGAALMSLGVYLTDHFRMPYWDWDAEGKYSKEDAYLLTYDKGGEVIRRSITKNDKRGPLGTEMDGPHSSEVFADSAIDFIQDYNQKQPFFLYLAFHAPHDPRHAPRKYKDMYPADEIQLPPSYMQEHPFDNGHLVVRDEKLAPWPRTPEVTRKHLSDYYTIITHLDSQIGRVIESLKASGQYENTLIALAGDSGLAVGCHGLLGKQSVYDEDGIHVPFILAGNKIDQGGNEIGVLCYIQDIFPTLCDLTGVNIPSSVTGRSLLPVIKGHKEQIREYTYHGYMHYQRAYRRGDYKLIEYVQSTDQTKKGVTFVRGSRVTQLFNYKEDPWETFNLAYFPEYEELLKSMRAGMRQAAEELGDDNTSIDYDYDFWDSYR